MTLVSLNDASMSLIEGEFVIRSMMTDLLHRTYSSDQQTFGTIEWKGEVEQHECTLSKVKLYSVLIHYLKSQYPAAITDLPYSGKSLRSRMSKLSELSATSPFPSDVSPVRLELTLETQGPIHIEEIMTTNFSFVTNILALISLVIIPEQDYFENLRNFIDR